MQKYFEKKSWYNPKFDVSEFDYTKLNTYEAANLALLIDFEGMKDEVYGANIDESIKSENNYTEDISGNLIPDSNSRYLSDDEISKLTEDEKLMVACEILARYGVDFTNMENGEKAQGYFEKQSWYTPTIDITEFDFTKLNMYEAANIKLLLNAEEDSELEESSEATDQEYILPYSSSKFLIEEDLAGLDASTLRLARNEIFARHGRLFQTADLNEYFSSKSWYSGYLTAEEFDDSVLNEYEKQNLDLIKTVEGRMGNNSAQLTVGDVTNIVYAANNSFVSMQISTRSDNQTSILFYDDAGTLWHGELYDVQNLNGGRIALIFNGIDEIAGTEDSVRVEWIAYDGVDNPIVYHENDADGMDDTYCYDHMLK